LTFYEKLKELAERQRLLISRGQSEALLEILAERQKLVNGLSDINRHMAGVRRDWDEIKAQMTEPQRSEAESLVTQVGQALQHILASDEADSQTLSNRRDQVGQSLTALRTKGVAATAYGQATGGNRYLDQDG
jgi:predicted DNA-binding helix-hairpin-helix protein